MNSPQATRPPSGLAHAQQALEIIDLARGRAHHRLKGEQQPVLAQRALDRGADLCGLRLPAPSGGGKAALHRSAAPEGRRRRRCDALLLAPNPFWQTL